MGKFPITRSQRGLPGTSGSVRANFDPATGEGEVGQAVGEFGVALGAGIKQRSEKREELRQALEVKNRKNVDVRETRKSQLSKEDFVRDVDTIKKTLPPEQWAGAIGERGTQYKSDTDALDLSPEARESLNIEISGLSQKIEDEAFADRTMRNKDTAIATTEEALVGLFRVGRPAREDLRKQVEILRFNGLSADEVVATINTAKDTGEKLRSVDKSDSVYAAIEASDYENAKKLAKDSDIPEPKQATLRSAITTAENAQIAKAEEAQRQAIEKSTGDAVRESYQGTLTVTELDKRHEDGLIKTPNYESMRKALAEKIPAISDPIVRSEISQAVTDFKAGQISKEAAQIVFLDALPLLDETDRKKFDNDIATTSSKLVETAMSNAKNSGKELVSNLTVAPDGKFTVDLTGVKGEKKIKEAKLRFNLEMRLKNIYNDSLDEWKESQKGKDIRPSDIRSIENDMLIDFRKIKARSLEDLRNIIQSKEAKKGTVPQEAKSLKQIQEEQLKPVKKQSIEELKAEREKLLKLRDR